MSPAVPRFGQAVSQPETPLLSLASQQKFAPRVRSMLEGILGLCSTSLESAVTATLNEAEQHLFKLAEKSRNNEEQHRCFESLREVKRGRADVAPRFLLSIEDALTRFDQRVVKADLHDRTKLPPGQTYTELSLVANSDLEQSMVLQEIASRAEIRQSPALYTLGHRFAVLAGSPVFDSESLPIGPLRLGEALRSALAEIEVPLEHRIVLFRIYERMVLANLGEFYESINEYLIGQRVLRNLRLTAPRRADGGVADPLVAAGEPTSVQTGSHEAAQASRAPSGFSSPQQTGFARSSHPEFAAPQSPYSPRVPLPTAVPGGWDGMGVGRQSATDERDEELFATLRELLAGRRHALGDGGATSVPGSYVASSNDLQTVLGALQENPSPTLGSSGRPIPRSVVHLKQDVMNQLRQLSVDGRPPQLAEEDSDTIDLVGMLFDYIGKQTRPTGGTQSLMSKLQVPLLRVALRDKSFFTRRTHPARQLLNAIAETGKYWVDDSDGDADHTLVEKMQLLVDRVSTDREGKAGLFEEMLGELSRHMGTLARKAEVSERRHVDAARGREKLDMARERASAAVATRLERVKTNKLLRTVLEQAWTDVLALTLLRQGEDSDAYRRRLAVADELIAATEGQRAGDRKLLSPELRKEVEAGMSQVGYHGDDINAVVKRLLTPEEDAKDQNASSHTELTIKLKAKARLGADTPDGPAGKTAPAKRKMLELNGEEQTMFERLKTLPFGTWFQFAINQQGETVRRKLSWFSTLTGRCLFVNQRGARTDERTLDQLARELVRGQVKLVEEEKESIVDRALNAIVGALKNFVGRGSDPLPVPA